MPGWGNVACLEEGRCLGEVPGCLVRSPKVGHRGQEGQGRGPCETVEVIHVHVEPAVRARLEGWQGAKVRKMKE
jgi:hypothetical protein